VLEGGEGESVDPVAPESKVPELHAPLPEAEEYHWYEKVDVPPDSWEVRVMAWPSSIAGEDGVTAPAERVGSTVTYTTLE
jgi:hypothetical protein